jgi:endonuclease-3
MNTKTLEKVLTRLEKESKNWISPIVTLISIRTKDPFRILISTVLSLRTKDVVTAKASETLFNIAKTPKEILKLNQKKIEELIYPVGFYRTKAKNIKKIAKIILDDHNGKVPDDLDELLTLPGIGRKTANLVITEAYNKPGICVDTHVHRISNRFGYVKTKNPYETEMALRAKLPKKWWKKYNNILVSFGQTICRPISPKCSLCPVQKYCEWKKTQSTRAQNS